MERDRDDESGRFTATVADDDLLAHLSSHEKPSQRTARAVADAVGLERSTAYRRLEQLADEGRVEKDDLGKNVVYLPCDDTI